jgi:hypothetical protein
MQSMENRTVARSQKSHLQDDGMPLQSKKNSSRLLSFSVFLISMLYACSAGRSVHSDAEAIQVEPTEESTNESQKAFADRNPMIVSHIGELELKIRMATLAEIPEDNYKMLPAEGAGYTALGWASYGATSVSALVFGGIFLIPLGTLYLHEKGIWDSINGALSNAEFTRAVDSAMKDRLNAAFTEESMPNVKIEIVIQAFGLVKSSSTLQHCLVVSANFILSRGNMELKRDHLQITNSNKSKDAPPPQCASLEHFARNEARLMKDILAEYAEVLAVMAIDRIPGESAK